MGSSEGAVAGPDLELELAFVRVTFETGAVLGLFRPEFPSPTASAAIAPMITGQGNGQGGREQGQKCDQLPGARDIENPEHRRHVAEVWGVPEPSIPRKGLSYVDILEAIHAGRIKGLLLLCSNPLVSAPDQNFTREAFERLEFCAVIDFFLSETARHADLVLPCALMEEDEGTTTSVQGRVILHHKAVEPPPGTREEWRISCDLAETVGPWEKFRFSATHEIFYQLLASSLSVDLPITT